MMTSEQGKRIQKLRNEKKISQKDLALLCGWTGKNPNTRIANYESGLREPSTIDFIKLADALNTKPEYLTYGVTEVSELYSKMPDGYVPIITWEQAEIFSNPFEDASKLPEITEYIINPHPSNKYKNLYALRIVGDSMIGHIKSFNPGSIIIIDPLLSPKHGDYVLVHDGTPDSEAILRKLTIEGGTSWLNALNPSYGPVRNLRDFHCIGTVIAHLDILRA